MAKLAVDGGPPVRDNFLVFGQPVLGEQEIAEVVDTLRSGWIGTGPRAKKFEEKFCEYTKCTHALAVNSCTAALHLALLALGMKAGDEVLVTALTFVASANVIIHCGATPVFVDINPADLNFDLTDLERKITPRTKAIVAVHFAGLPVNLKALNAIAQRHRLGVVEDAAHAIGASIDGVKIGNGPNLTAFSFYANKNITTGEGGMLACTGMSDETYEFLAAMRLHGLTNDAWRRFQVKSMVHSEVMGAGFKYNMPDLQAALGLHQIDRLDSFLAKREIIAARYRVELAGIPAVRLQSLPTHYGQLRHGLHLFVLVIDPAAYKVDRNAIVAALRAENIGATVHYGSVPTHRFYRDTFESAHKTTPIANAVGDTILSLPLRPDFTERDERDVITAVQKVFKHYYAG
jgi:dTDP-4-amino-4,6-dideoxygalactose transaminase